MWFFMEMVELLHQIRGINIGGIAMSIQIPGTLSNASYCVSLPLCLKSKISSTSYSFSPSTITGSSGEFWEHKVLEVFYLNSEKLGALSWKEVIANEMLWD